MRLSATSRSGRAKVWIGPEPAYGSHSNIVGEITADALGVHVPAGSTYEFYEPGDWKGDKNREPDEWPEDATIPWHRVDQINWLEDEDDA